MLQCWLYLILTLSFAQLTIQNSIKTPSSFHHTKRTVQAHRNLSESRSALNGYESFSGFGYYKFYPEGTHISYYEAKKTCERDGAHLAIINSEAEVEVLKALYAIYPDVNQWAYIGFNDIEEEGKYVTIFGDPLQATGYEKWHEGEPNGDGDCGSVHRDGGLNDAPCDLTSYPEIFPFFCEYEQ